MGSGVGAGEVRLRLKPGWGALGGRCAEGPESGAGKRTSGGVGTEPGAAGVIRMDDGAGRAGGKPIEDGSAARAGT